MGVVVRETFARQRFSALLLGGFSLVSLLLAAVGIYGVLACSVTERTREIGVRVALGAEPGRILTLVLCSGMRVVVFGTLVGIGSALALTGLLKSLLFGVGARCGYLRHGAGGADCSGAVGRLPACAPGVAAGAGACTEGRVE